MARLCSLLTILVAFLLLRTVGADQRSVTLRTGLAQPGWFKVSHEYVVAFDRVQKLPGLDSIEVFDREGRRVVALDVLGQLPGAIEVVLDDAAVRSGGPLVAGATIRAKDGGLQDVLLYFTWRGELERCVAIPPEQEINNIDLDEDGNVWTLTDYFGRKDETTGPLIFAYDPSGHLIKGLLRRTDYPAGFREDARRGGLAGFGVIRDGVWFWQPSRHRMTVVSRTGEVLKQLSIALPRSHADRSRAHAPEVDFVALLPSGQVVAGIVCPWPDVPTGAYLSRRKHFVRSSPQHLRLIGVDGSDLVFLKLGEASSGRFEILREPLEAGSPAHA